MEAPRVCVARNRAKGESGDTEKGVREDERGRERRREMYASRGEEVGFAGIAWWQNAR